MNCWDKIKNLEGLTLKTLQYDKEFDVLLVDDSKITVRVHSSNEKRNISKQSIESCYQDLVVKKELTLKGTRTFSEYHPTYVIAILSQLPNIEIKKRPRIKLTLKN